MRDERKRGTISLGHFFQIGMFSAYVALSILLIILDWNLIRNNQRQIENEIKEAVENSLEQAEQSMLTVRNRIYEIWMFDSYLEEISRNPYNNGKYSQPVGSLCMELKNIMAADNNLHGFYLYYPSDEGCRYAMNESIITQEEIKMLCNFLGNYVQGNTENNMDSRKTPWITAAAGEVPILAVGYQKGQTVLFGLYSLRKLEETIKIKFPKQKVALCYLSDGIYLSGNENGRDLYQEMAGKTIDGYYEQHSIEKDIYGQRLADTNVDLLISVEKNKKGYLNGWILVLLGIEVLSVLAFLKFLLTVTNEIVSPLDYLMKKMNQIRTGEKIEKDVQKSYRVKELQLVNDVFDDMICEVQKQKNKVYEELLLRQKIQLQYYQLQLKPHFYLNNLKVLNALAMNQENQKMQEMILEMSAHLRYLMNKDTEWVTVSEELSFCRNYVELQKKMSGREIVYLEEAEDQVKEIRIPVLCIQTFVENSIKYAKLENGWDILKVYISLHLITADESTYLNIIVKDNGKGYPSEILKEQTEKVNGPVQDEEQTHIGIFNVRMRCGMLYGEKAEISLYNAGGAVSDLILPVRWNSNGEVEQDESFDRG